MPSIAEIEAIIVSVPAEGNAFAEGSEETLLVRVTDEDGLHGIGECVAVPEVVKAMVEQPTVNFWSQGIRDVMVGKDPLEARALYDRAYHGSFYHGRRGVLVFALSAVDIALHDLAGKQIGQPAYRLLGGARCERLRPYATLYPGDVYDRPVAEVLAALEAQARTATDQGLRTVKVPVLFGGRRTDAEVEGFVRECRRMVGDGISLALDFGYRWRDWHDAARVLQGIEDCGIEFAEAPLWHDDMRGHARLAAASPVRVGGAEFATGRWEIRDWLEQAEVSLVQPGVSRAGGFTELTRIAEMCEMHGASLIPHSYATGITDVCNLHLQAASLTVPMVEFRSPRLGSSRLRAELVAPAEPEIVDGYAGLPTGPGLGVELNEEFVARYRRQAEGRKG